MLCLQVFGCFVSKEGEFWQGWKATSNAAGGKKLSQKLAGKLKGFALQLNVHEYKKKWEKKYNPTVEEIQSGGVHKYWRNE